MTNENRRSRHGFTLIELLTVISIIAFMSGMFLVAYRGAAQESNTQKTRSTLQKIGDVLNARMEEYSTYPLVLKTPAGFPIPPNTTTPLTETKTLLLERARLLCLRELIAMEMPDHPDDLKWSDKWVTNPSQTIAVVLNSVPRSVPTGLFLGATPLAVRNTTTSRMIGLARKLSNSLGRPIPGWQTTNANAELLYLVIEDSDLNGSSAIELFGASEIGDTDNDGLKEFIDSFGQPIQWIRWPTGYEGISRYHPDLMAPGIVVATPSGIKLTVESDPLDRMNADPGYFTSSLAPGPGAFPLVISGGLDQKVGLRIESKGTMAASTSYSVIDAQWSGAPSYLNGARFSDPWYPRNSPGDRLGSRLNSSADDDLTNYDGNGAAL